MPTPVVADTNALLLPFELNVRIEEELARLLGSYEVVVPEAVLVELAEIAAQAKGQRRENAKMALTLASRFGYHGGAGRGDRAVLAAARDLGAHLFTNDRELQAKARSQGVTLVRLKGRGHLIVETPDGETR